MSLLKQKNTLSAEGKAPSEEVYTNCLTFPLQVALPLASFTLGRRRKQNQRMVPCCPGYAWLQPIAMIGGQGWELAIVSSLVYALSKHDMQHAVKITYLMQEMSSLEEKYILIPSAEASYICLGGNQDCFPNCRVPFTRAKERRKWFPLGIQKDKR